MTSGDLSRLEDRLGHRFRTLFFVARLPTLVHHQSTDPERLNLGDRVLGLIIADILISFPMGRRRFRLPVYGPSSPRDACLRCSEDRTGRNIAMSDGERVSGGAAKDSVLANARP